MNKFITYIVLAIVGLLLFWLVVPKSCEPSGKYEHLESKSNQSRKAESIQEIETKRIRKTNDSIRAILQDSLVKEKAKNEKLSISYYALRAKVKKLQSVKVDSINQVVEIPAETYNDVINNGNEGYELLQGKDAELAIKDSIISIRDMDVKALTDLVEAKQLSNNDLLALIDELKNDLKRCKNQNKGLKIALLIDTLLHLVH